MPYEYVDSVYDIDYHKLKSMGYKGLLFDIDNTLVHHGDDSNPKVDKFFEKLNDMGFKCVMVSDNNEERILRFLKNIDALYIAEAGKPGTKCFYKAMKMLNMNKNEVVMIGDQIFTDIRGANRAGIASILVHYIVIPGVTKIGKKRMLEKAILLFHSRSKKYNHRLGSKEKLFCERGPVHYWISEKKEITKRHIKNVTTRKRFCDNISGIELPNVVHSVSNALIKKGPGIDPESQINKATNIMIACSKINGLILEPGEEFSFWNTVGKTTKRNGFKAGRVIKGNDLTIGIGGGLCNLANSLHLVILHSPIQVTEVHYHSDALAADPGGVRVPFSAGTSVSYNYIDFRFRNNTHQQIQLLARVSDEKLFVELRSERPFKRLYEIEEEDHHFTQEDGTYYRVSKIYKVTYDRDTKEVVKRKLIRDNHSQVMFDYDLIPKELIT